MVHKENKKMNRIFLTSVDPLKDDNKNRGVELSVTNEELETILNIAIRNNLFLVLQPLETEEDYDLIGEK